MFSRLRRALVPKDPLYRRESGAGQRVVLVAKSVGLLIVLAAYLFWATMALAGKEDGSLAVLITAVASHLFCLIAFALGVQSIRNEIVGGTAEALVLTPMSRRKLILSKLAGASEFLVIAALLIPLYCLSVASATYGNAPVIYIAGGALRSVIATEWGNWLFIWDNQSYMVDTLVGLAAFVGDLCWYLLFAACGLWAGVLSRTTAGAWIKGIMTCCGLFLALTAFDWLPNAFHGFYDGPAPRWWLWVPMSFATRIVAARFLLRRTIRNFDRIATD